MFRNNSGSFSTDKLALEATKYAISNEYDKLLTPLERSMIYMPLMHSESLEVHENLSIPTFKALAEEIPSMEGSLKYELMHANIIRTWGRYPHRNTILNRDSTPEEEEFLKQPGSSF